MNNGTPDPQPAAPKPALRRWLRIVLYASLAVNLLVVGLVAGMVVNGGPPSPRDRGGDTAAATPFIRAMAGDDRRAIRRDLRRTLSAGRSNGDSGGEPATLLVYRDALAVLRAEPFDRAALNDVFVRQNRAAAQRHRIGQEVLLTYIANLDPRARAAYADRLADELKRFGRRKPRTGD